MADVPEWVETTGEVEEPENQARIHPLFVAFLLVSAAAFVLVLSNPNPSLDRLVIPWATLFVVGTLISWFVMISMAV